MLGLKLRDEFLGTHMPGTAISLRTGDNQGAAQRSPQEILSITYPTADIIVALKAISVKCAGRPIVLMGDRGRGKSHIMAVMHHAVQASEVVEEWLKDWGGKLGNEELKNMQMLKGYIPISEPVHNHEYPLLWNLLFDRHPKGEYYRGQFENMSQPFPPRTLLERMFEDIPTCLILDEFQTWITGLPEKDPKSGLLLRQYAYNFVQILSEIATDRPDILLFVISVLNNQNEAFQQVHRQGPIVVDFRGPSAKQDRQRLLLHRLFENRRNITEPDIENLVGAYASERFRLLYANKSEAEKERLRQEVFMCWPFSPELLDLLEDHILLAQAAQETRDLIRILAHVYRSREHHAPIITPADFFVDEVAGGVETLVDSIASQADQARLRQIAQRNLEAVCDSGVTVPHARELVSAIWMRSMSPGRNAGGTTAELHLDITRDVMIDDNAFQAEIALLIENSVNIHGDEVFGGPLWFGVNENPRSKVRACAKNHKLWQSGAISATGQTVYPGKDIAHIRNTLRHILVPETTQPPSRVIVLGPNWQNDPWSEVEEADLPAKWDRVVLLVIPDPINGGRAGINACLGAWLTKHVQKRRNTVRFLLPASEMPGLYADEELIYSARCSFLSSREGWGGDSTYKSLHQDFDRPLRQMLKARFNRFAILRKWDFQLPLNCVFEIESPRISRQGDIVLAQGGDIPSGVEQTILKTLFDHVEFKDFVLKLAKDSDFVGSLMDDLMEPPPPNTGDAIPFLGETKLYECILDIAAEGDLILNVGGSWIGRRVEDANLEDSRRHMKKAFRAGQEMRQVQLGLPGSAGGGTIPGEPPKPPGGSGIIGDPPPPKSDPPPSGGSGTIEEPPPGGEVLPSIELPPPQTRKSGEPATGINLSGCFESWGLPSTQSIDTSRIEFVGLSVQQMKLILQRIPSTFKATLEIVYKDGGGQ